MSAYKLISAESFVCFLSCFLAAELPSHANQVRLDAVVSALRCFMHADYDESAAVGFFDQDQVWDGSAYRHLWASLTAGDFWVRTNTHVLLLCGCHPPASHAQARRAVETITRHTASSTSIAMVPKIADTLADTAQIFRAYAEARGCTQA